MAEAKKRYAIVTGANRGVGFGTCKVLASKGVTVVLTARDEKKGLEATENLKNLGLSDHVLFHQLDVTDAASIASLVDFVRTKFGKLDILVNNAAVPGGIVEEDALIRKRNGAQVHWNEIVHQSYELAEECVEINFCGVERVTEALLPLLNLSTSPRIVNVSSQHGLLKNIPNEWAKGVFTDIENLTRERLYNVLKEFLKDFKAGLLESKGWPSCVSGYTVSKAALNAYTRKLAKDFPHFRINSLCPGYVKTDMNRNTGILSIDEGAESPVKLALLPDNGPSGLFFDRDEVSPF